MVLICYVVSTNGIPCRQSPKDQPPDLFSMPSALKVAATILLPSRIDAILPGLSYEPYVALAYGCKHISPAFPQHRCVLTQIGTDFLLGHRRRTSAVRIRPRKLLTPKRPDVTRYCHANLTPSTRASCLHAGDCAPRTLVVCLYPPGPWNPRRWSPENRVLQITRREWIHSRLSLLEDRRLWWDLGRGQFWSQPWGQCLTGQAHFHGT